MAVVPKLYMAGPHLIMRVQHQPRHQGAEIEINK